MIYNILYNPSSIINPINNDHTIYNTLKSILLYKRLDYYFSGKLNSLDKAFLFPEHPT